MPYSHLTLEEQVAQLFMVGYTGLTPQAITHQFLERGVGGLIFFRDNFDGLPPGQPHPVHALLNNLKAAIPAHLPAPLLGIDQEGGQVERLPHTLFPTALTPQAIALANDSETLAHSMYRDMARHLASLGFNLDFFPTLDVNLNPQNPIIGVRSFGDDPETVWNLAQIAMREFEQAGIITVGKHFPGHGNGTVDSHLDLPTLHFTEDELKPFQQAIQAGLPVMLVAHGFYLALQTTEDEAELPSSASPAIIQGLLRQQCGFQGVIITDDMCMGAITRHRNPVEAALASLEAGVDILLYKQSTSDEWAVYEAVVDAFRRGRLPMSRLQESLARITTLKQTRLKQFVPEAADILTPNTCQQIADATARSGITCLAGNPTRLPLPTQTTLGVIHPDRTSLGNYAFDVPTSDELPALLNQIGFSSVLPFAYPFNQAFSLETWLETLSSSPDAWLFITFNPLLNPMQVAAYTLLKERFPETPLILVSAGTPYDRQVMPHCDLHISLCSYRPASMKALAHVMKTGLATSPSAKSNAAKNTVNAAY